MIHEFQTLLQASTVHHVNR